MAVPIREGASHVDTLQLVLGLINTVGDGPDYKRFATVKPGSRRFLDPRAWKADLPGADEDTDEE